MNELIYRVLEEKCASCFAVDYEKQLAGELEEKLIFGWQSFFVNAGLQDVAVDFTKLNPNCTDNDLDDLEKFIYESAEKGIKPTRCIKFGCTEEQIAYCHDKVIHNKSGEPSNSPAYFISEDKLKAFQKMEEFEELKDEIFERITLGEKSAIIDETFIKAAAELKATNSISYQKFKDELSELKDGSTGKKVSLSAFNEEVDKLTKNISKQKATVTVEQINLPDNLKPYAVDLNPNEFFVDENGHIHVMIHEKDDSYPAQVSNFVARIKEVREFDDGVDVEQQFVIDGILDGEKPLPEIIINAKDFKSMSWVLRKWGNILITSVPKAHDIIREVIQRTSANAPVVKVYYTLGWKNVAEKWHYLFSGGSIGDGDISVADIHEVNGYFYKEYPYTVDECVPYIEKFLNIAPHDITIPLLAHSFLSILIEKLKQEEIEPRYLLWVYGVSGSFKTALTVVLQNLFGTFNSPPATFNDTAAAMEKKSYLTKDSLLLVDDFYPASSPHEAKSKATIANGLTRRYGDRITRSRSKSNLTLAKDYPPRGNLICTSEDLLVGHSTNSRHMGISINRGDIKPEILTELQNNKDRLSCFMYNFIQYVAENIMNDDTVTYKDKFLEYRSQSQNSNHHKRFAEAIACLQIGWETLLDYLQSIDFIDDTKYKHYFDEGFEIFQDLAKHQNELVQNDDIADKFMTALKEMLDTKQLVPQNKDVPSTILTKLKMIWYNNHREVMTNAKMESGINERRA